MYRFLKKHLFWSIVGFIFALYFAFLALVFFAPHQDALQRGFIPCTLEMIDELSLCKNNKVSCTFKLVLKNNVCDFKVVKKGFDLWLEGLESTPWSYYYFTPTTDEPSVLEDAALKDYYEQHQNIIQEMEDLNQKAIALEKQQEKSKNEETPK